MVVVPALRDENISGRGDWFNVPFISRNSVSLSSTGAALAEVHKKNMITNIP